MTVLVFIPELDQIILNSIKKQIMSSSAPFQLLEIMELLKQSQHSDVNIKLINYQLKEVQDMQKMLISNKYKL